MASNKDNGYQYHDHKALIGDDELMTVYEIAHDLDKDTFKAKDIAQECEFNPMQVGRRLSHLEDRELIERRRGQSPHTWRVK